MAKTLQEYLDLVPAMNANKPKFIAMLTALLKPLISADQAAIATIQAYDLDFAIGAQLDVLGEWIGRKRQLETTIEGVYFSFDDEALGFDMGVWLGPFDPISGLTSLPDDIYRELLKLKARVNIWDGTNEQIAGIFESLADLFPGTEAFVQDDQDMTFAIGIIGPVPPPILRALLLTGYVPAKPSGVRLDYIITTVTDAPLFGLDADNDQISGFDIGNWGETA